ncbi:MULTISPECIES: Asp23/Gls24 family envelope stress response protein [Sinobaca]|uniref:Putative alkaline shock family protein YloU n=1 Tax=Sinobaca qinghaiensis TaxID=342944 RepID=A0A419V612_9BACL|nr:MULTISPECIES: Asp23/Gls24 family envelope stress response protein [Sinobaca]RKD75410.1 putative alkaline shock family protein YloU [Sinobaca qinghaiensis]
MTIEVSTTLGKIEISDDTISTAAGGAAVDCYGIVGMASQKHFKDGISDLLKKENIEKGIVLRREKEEVHIDMYIIVSYGIKISEVASNVQSAVKYQIKHMLGIDVKAVNVYVQGVRVIDA